MKQRPARRPPLAERLAETAVWILLVVTPLVVVPTARDPFRLPKLLVAEWLALASLIPLAWLARSVPAIRPRDLWASPAVRAVAPALLVATAGLATSAHPLHVREGLADLWIGAACLVGWSLGLSSGRLDRLLGGLLWPASAVALLGILQFHGLWEPLGFAGVHDPRLTVTSTTGNPGDLAAFLVLPCLVAQRRLAGSRPGLARWGAAAALAVCIYGLAITQTLAAVAAVAVGTLAFWWVRLPRRAAVAGLAAGAALAAVLVLAVAPLRGRVAGKLGELRSGDLNTVLTGRLDGWRAAVWMLGEHPLAGVGHGAYRPEFVPAKLALLERDVPFYERHEQPVFANAHNEYLEVAAEWGLPGLVALGWGIWCLAAAARRTGSAGDPDRALAWAGLAGVAVLALAHFPFRIALVAFPALLFLAWICRRGAPGEAR